MIGDTHVVQCKILGWPAFLHYGTEVHDAAIVDNTFLHGYRRHDSHTDFARGREAWVRPSCVSAEEREEIARRAESLVGTSYAYSLLRNNCEHVANWCATGIAVSHQVLTTLRRIFGTFLAALGVVLIATR